MAHVVHTGRGRPGARRNPVRLLEYDLDPRAEAYGLEAAEKLGLPPERVFKTLVVAVDGGYVFALVPVAARLTGARTLRLVAAGS